jgi:hypothetical protein
MYPVLRTTEVESNLNLATDPPSVNFLQKSLMLSNVYAVYSKIMYVYAHTHTHSVLMGQGLLI